MTVEDDAYVPPERCIVNLDEQIIAALRRVIREWMGSPQPSDELSDDKESTIESQRLRRFDL